MNSHLVAPPIIAFRSFASYRAGFGTRSHAVCHPMENEVKSAPYRMMAPVLTASLTEWR